MSDPPLSDIDFENKMALVCTTLNSDKNELGVFQNCTDVCRVVDNLPWLNNGLQKW